MDKESVLGQLVIRGSWLVQKVIGKVGLNLAVRKEDPELFKERLKFYSPFIKKGDLCFDIGAYLGERTAVFLALDARVVAVEPQKGCCQFLRQRFKGNPDLVIVQRGVAAKKGALPFRLGGLLSTFSEEWRSAVIRSGRFLSYCWGKKTLVSVTTLDALIKKFGAPQFCKIDVEGFEYEVLKGLSQPLPIVSFEFTYPEYFNKTKACLDYLVALGRTKFNLSVGDSLVLEFKNWVAPKTIEEKLKSFGKEILFGDIYVRYR